MKGIYSFYWPYYRGGNVDGTFVATAEQVAGIIGKYVYFGEIRGKHSEVSGTVEDCVKTHVVVIMEKAK